MVGLGLDYTHILAVRDPRQVPPGIGAPHQPSGERWSCAASGGGDLPQARRGGRDHRPHARLAHHPAQVPGDVPRLLRQDRDAAWSKCILGGAPARLLCLLRARLAALGSSALPGRARPFGA
eukprot:scaffold22283_cov57-Phaeocystis_antarctica.AAC.2